MFFVHSPCLPRNSAIAILKQIPELGVLGKTEADTNVPISANFSVNAFILSDNFGF
jgi:hypothetical protein